MLPSAIRRPVTRLVRSLRRRAFGPRAVEGAPPGLPAEVLDALCLEHLGHGLEQCSHLHLSSWKPRGTYRLHITAGGGRSWRLIFKDELYATDLIPALGDLPILPGPPEFAIYGLKEPRLEPFLPKVYWRREVKAGRHFQYIMGDLEGAFERMRKERGQLVLAARALLQFQQALKGAFERGPHPYLIRYDGTYSGKLIDYVARSLEAYRAGRQVGSVDELCRSWQRVARAHGRDEFQEPGLRGPIHGDYNRSNVHLQASGPALAKVVDWEWAGIGLPHADLAALLKLVSPEDERAVLEVFISGSPGLDAEAHWRTFRWCQLERRLMDAGFLARQQMASPRRVRWLEGYIDRAAADVLRTVGRLEAAPGKPVVA
jgi:Phosphotransferase enzyme family